MHCSASLGMRPPSTFRFAASAEAEVPQRDEPGSAIAQSIKEEPPSRKRREALPYWFPLGARGARQGRVRGRERAAASGARPRLVVHHQNVALRALALAEARVHLVSAPASVAQVAAVAHGGRLSLLAGAPEHLLGLGRQPLRHLLHRAELHARRQAVVNASGLFAGRHALGA